jgi:SAM-dependent methyltransferase
VDDVVGSGRPEQLVAATYDAWTCGYQWWREVAIDALPVGRGQTVVDVGCGTGACFARLVAKVGRAGRVIGVDASAAMLAIASRRVDRQQWPQVTLVHAPAATARLPARADAALFCAVHDLLQDEASVANVLDQLHPRAWVVATGGRWLPPLLVLPNLMLSLIHAPYVHDFRGFDRPWLVLARRLATSQVIDLAGGTGYLLRGRVDHAEPRGSLPPSAE